MLCITMESHIYIHEWKHTVQISYTMLLNLYAANVQDITAEYWPDDEHYCISHNRGT